MREQHIYIYIYISKKSKNKKKKTKIPTYKIKKIKQTTRT